MKRHHMAAAEFGLRCMNDVAFVYRLRGGLDIRTRTLDKVQAFMRDYGRPLAATTDAHV